MQPQLGDIPVDYTDLMCPVWMFAKGNMVIWMINVKNDCGFVRRVPFEEALCLGKGSLPRRRC